MDTSTSCPTRQLAADSIRTTIPLARQFVTRGLLCFAALFAIGGIAAEPPRTGALPEGTRAYVSNTHPRQKLDASLHGAGNPIASARAELRKYRAELDRFRQEYAASDRVPNVPFFLFGMGLRAKFLYQSGRLMTAPEGVVLREWPVREEIIVPSEYRVVLLTENGRTVSIYEDTNGVWISERSRAALANTEQAVQLPDFAGHPYARVLRVLHQELLVNVMPHGPVPNFFVYAKPWYRDGAMMALAFKETGNIDVIRDWIFGLRQAYDRNNNGETEADNLGQALYLVSLVSDTNHPLVAKVLAELPRFERQRDGVKFIQGRSDFAEHPVYQTKWLKFGLRALGLPDDYSIPQQKDSYSALFWMDYKDAYVPGDSSDRGNYPYLGWACDHFHGVKKSPISNCDYPLTWEARASQAKYEGARVISDEYVTRTLAAPHTWHAAEVFLYLLAQQRQGGSAEAPANAAVAAPVKGRQDDPAAKPRLIVLTDIGGDPDDQQSMIRLMLYANEFDLEGLIASASGTPGELKESVVKPHLIREIVEAYGKVRPNLVNHADGFPAAEALRAKIKSGNPNRGTNFIGAAHDTEGSRWIISVVDKPDARPVNIAIWGGQTDLAQALWRVRADRGAAGLKAFIAKIRVHDIDDQDRIAEWIWREFPGLFYVLSKAAKGADKREGAYRGMYLGGNLELVSREWIETHVRQNHGPLGALYPPRTWTAPNPHSALKEGDTPSWLFFLRTGLNDTAHPEWGGLGGRFTNAQQRIYRDASDSVDGITDARAAVWRWREAVQNDFQARLDWCTTGDFAGANHNPVAVLNGDISADVVPLRVRGGEMVRLSAAGSRDPDQHELTMRWFIYPEAGDRDTAVTLSKTNGLETGFVAPMVNRPRALHVLLEVRDDGTPNLYAFRRAVVTLDP